jgi:Arabinose efflux permease
MQATKQLSPGRIALLIGGLSMFGPFAIDAIFPAFPQMGAQLGADKLAMQQTISVYLLAYAFMSLFHGALSDALGRKRVIVGGLVVFILASIGCALSRDMGTLLFFRALQGLSAGVGYIIGRAVIRDLYEGDDAQRLMSHVSMVFSIAPAIAPIIGGLLLGWTGWTGVFWFLVGFSTLLLLTTWLWLPETHPPHARQPACRPAGTRLHRHRLQWALPAPGRCRCAGLRRTVPVHRLGSGLRDGPAAPVRT